MAKSITRRFRMATLLSTLRVVGDANGADRHGSALSCRLLKRFQILILNLTVLEQRLRELAFLNSGVRIILEDERPAESLKTELYYEGGVKEFVKYLDRSKSSVMDEPIYIMGEKDDIVVEVAHVVE